MITFKELIKDCSIADIPWEHQINLEELLKRINKVRSIWGKPLIITSGYRSLQDHIRIYSTIASKKGIPFDKSKVPMKSKHLSGQAIDVFDPKKELQAWCKNNEALLAEVGLWMEDFSATPNWCHFQIVPPASGKRWFLP